MCRASKTVEIRRFDVTHTETYNRRHAPCIYLLKVDMHIAKKTVLVTGANAGITIPDDLTDLNKE